MSNFKNSTIILGIVFLLTIIGLITIYSAGGKIYLLRQSIWVLLALIILYLITKLPTRFWMNFGLHLFLFILSLLILVLLVGKGSSRRWFNLGFFNIQPSELAKIAFIVFTAQTWAYKKISFRLKDLFLPVMAALIYSALVLIEPDLGTGLIFLPVLAGMMYQQGISLFDTFLLFSPLFSFVFGFSIYLWILYFILMAIVTYRRTTIGNWLVWIIINILAGLSSPIIWSHMKDYQKARILGFLAPWLDPKGMSWNLIQSQIAIGSGRIWGKGFLSGTQKRLAFLPNRETDFIFSTLAEEFGFIGAIFAVGLYFSFLYQIFKLSLKIPNEFARLVVMGILVVFSYQIIVNIGMVLGLLPITGIALPFLSYGGSSLIVSYLMVGMIIAFARESDL
jgi:rod shape determining protein RodA